MVKKVAGICVTSLAVWDVSRGSICGEECKPLLDAESSGILILDSKLCNCEKRICSIYKVSSIRYFVIAIETD